jgi:hypothetical protein
MSNILNINVYFYKNRFFLKNLTNLFDLFFDKFLLKQKFVLSATKIPLFIFKKYIFRKYKKKFKKLKNFPRKIKKFLLKKTSRFRLKSLFLKKKLKHTSFNMNLYNYFYTYVRYLKSINYNTYNYSIGFVYQHNNFIVEGQPNSNIISVVPIISMFLHVYSLVKSVIFYKNKLI